MPQTQAFLFPRSRYYRQVLPENLVFNANLQELRQRINLIANLETSGKLSPEASYIQILAIWEQLKRSKKQLGIDQEPFQDESEVSSES